MNETQKPGSHFPRPSGPGVFVSFVAIVGCFLAFALVVWLAYLPNRGPGVTVDIKQVSEDMQWKYSAEGRRTRLDENRAREIDELNNYAWVDQSAGIVRVPIDTAMELIVSEQKGAQR